MTPSAYSPISSTCSRVETPRPTHTRSAPAARARATTSSAAEDTLSRAPVTPITDTAYTKPDDACTVMSMRSRVVDGATRKIRSSPCSSEAANHSPASSGIRSGVMIPAPPASLSRRANSSTPVCSTGFQ